MDFTEIKRRLMTIDVSQLCDVTTKLRVLDPMIRSITSGVKMLGIARTVDCREDNLIFFKTLFEIKPDEVLVVAANNTEKALFGEIMTTFARQKQPAGIVCDGACRDIKVLRQLDIPIFVKHIYPQAVNKEKIGESQIPIVCGGVEVIPGEIVFGDDDGVIVIDKQALIEALPLAEALRDKEQRTIAYLKAGKSLNQILTNFDEYYSAVKANKKTTLKWELD